ncbi:MAG: TAT-variant-translocated molybdopterin oxidoreductase, partial [Saprospiraceae bacterium]|nr:TAT-variant-translocated molybdopterin oxidoreductase [Saprospiraceae bacterium]
MKNHHKDVWIGVEDKTQDPEFIESLSQEFKQLPIVESITDEKTLDVSSNRRDFLKYLGFGLGAATLAASCDIPVKRAIPYVTKPDEIVPGVANYYASAIVQGGDYCPVLVKTREGRPIKIEGNSMSSMTGGGTSARAQAAVLSLYDSSRLRGPSKMEGGELKPATWDELDKAATVSLSSAKNIRILSNTILSPTAKNAVEEFTQKYPTAKLVQYDPSSSSAMLLANENSFGKKVVPNYHFNKAEVIVGVGADFLGTWISPIEYAKAYAENRKINNKKKTMSFHVQVESGMSLTGSNADNRIQVKPSEQGAAIAYLYNEVAKLTGGSTISAPSLNAKATAALCKLAGKLAGAKGKSLVVSGSNNTAEQVIVNKINYLLDNYGNTLDFGAYSLQRQGVDKDVNDLVADMNAGRVDALIVWGANPAYDLPNAAEFVAGLENVQTSISMNSVGDETASLCSWQAPASHNLESWGDVEAKAGQYALVQPTISPLFDTRQAEASILVWSGSSNYNMEADQPMYDYLKKG